MAHTLLAFAELINLRREFHSRGINRGPNLVEYKQFNKSHIHNKKMFYKGLALAALALVDLAEAQKYLTCNWRNTRGNRQRPTLIATQDATGNAFAIDLGVDQIKRGAKDYDYQLDIITTLDATFATTVATFDTRGCEESVDSVTGIATTTLVSDNLITSTGVSRDALVYPRSERSYRVTSAT